MWSSVANLSIGIREKRAIMGTQNAILAALELLTAPGSEANKPIMNLLLSLSSDPLCAAQLVSNYFVVEILLELFQKASSYNVQLDFAAVLSFLFANSASGRAIGLRRGAAASLFPLLASSRSSLRLAAEMALDALFLEAIPRSAALDHGLDLTATASHVGMNTAAGLVRNSLWAFETVRGAARLADGKWYYEVKVEDGGVYQIGLAAVSAQFNVKTGVGDNANSYAWDGGRVTRWHKRKAVEGDYGRRWERGDTVGVWYDADHRHLSYSLNGEFLGVAFELPHDGQVYQPALSLDPEKVAVVNFGSRPFAYPPTPASCFRPVCEASTWVGGKVFDLELAVDASGHVGLVLESVNCRLVDLRIAVDQDDGSVALGLDVLRLPWEIPGGIPAPVVPKTASSEAARVSLAKRPAPRSGPEAEFVNPAAMQFYFEIHIAEMPSPDAVVLGLTSSRAPIWPNRSFGEPGRNSKSLGIDSSGVLRVGGQIVEVEPWFAFGAGDVVGLGYDDRTACMYLTRNGSLVGSVPLAASSLGGGQPRRHNIPLPPQPSAFPPVAASPATESEDDEEESLSPEGAAQNNDDESGDSDDDDDDDDDHDDEDPDAEFQEKMLSLLRAAMAESAATESVESLPSYLGTSPVPRYEDEASSPDGNGGSPSGLSPGQVPISGLVSSPLLPGPGMPPMAPRGSMTSLSTLASTSPIRILSPQTDSEAEALSPLGFDLRSGPSGSALHTQPHTQAHLPPRATGVDRGVDRRARGQSSVSASTVRPGPGLGRRTSASSSLSSVGAVAGGASVGAGTRSTLGSVSSVGSLFSRQSSLSSLSGLMSSVRLPRFFPAVVTRVKGVSLSAVYSDSGFVYRKSERAASALSLAQEKLQYYHAIQHELAKLKELLAEL